MAHGTVAPRHYLLVGHGNRLINWYGMDGGEIMGPGLVVLILQMAVKSRVPGRLQVQIFGGEIMGAGHKPVYSCYR